MPRSRRVHPRSTLLRSHYPHITHGLVRRISRHPDFFHRVRTLMPYVHMRNSLSLPQFTTDNHRRNIAVHIITSHMNGHRHHEYMSRRWSDFETS